MLRVPLQFKPETEGRIEPGIPRHGAEGWRIRSDRGSGQTGGEFADQSDPVFGPGAANAAQAPTTSRRNQIARAVGRDGRAGHAHQWADAREGPGATALGLSTGLEPGAPESEKRPMDPTAP